MAEEEPLVAYLSIDIEADGPKPALHSMLSFGGVLFTVDGLDVIEIDTIEVNIDRRTDRVEDADTMEWWADKQEAWDACHTDAVSPAHAVAKISLFLRKWEGVYKIIWVAQPVSFDWPWMVEYFGRFGDTYTLPWKCVGYSSMRKHWLAQNQMTRAAYSDLLGQWMVGCVQGSHKAVEDARWQGREFLGFMIHTGAI